MATNLLAVTCALALSQHIPEFMNDWVILDGKVALRCLLILSRIILLRFMISLNTLFHVMTYFVVFIFGQWDWWHGVFY